MELYVKTHTWYVRFASMKIINYTYILCISKKIYFFLKQQLKHFKQLWVLKLHIFAFYAFGLLFHESSTNVGVLFSNFPPSAVSSLYWKFRFRRQTVNLKAEWVYKIGLLSLNAPNSFYASLIRLIIVPARNSNSHIIIFYWLDLPEPGGGSFW